MTNRVVVGNLRVAEPLYDFITNEALPGTGIDPGTFWSGVDKVVTDLTPRNDETSLSLRLVGVSGDQES